MKTYVLEFDDQETMPDLIEKLANELQLTPVQLILRFVAKGVTDAYPESGPSLPGKSMEDFLVKNGALKSAKRDGG